MKTTKIHESGQNKDLTKKVIGYTFTGGLLAAYYFGMKDIVHDFQNNIQSYNGLEEACVYLSCLISLEQIVEKGPKLGQKTHSIIEYLINKYRVDKK